MIGDVWDERYLGEEYRYGTDPNVFLQQESHRLPPGGKVLCVGDGEGRNGVWLAEQGFAVTSLEPSSVGVEKIRRLAAQRDVEVDVIHDALPDHPLQGGWDAVVLIFVHMPPPMREAVHRQVADALAPGGVVMLEAYTPAQLQTSGVGGPPDEALMFTAEMLERDFAGFEIEVLVETFVDLAEGPSHQGESAVVRLVARR